MVPDLASPPPAVTDFLLSYPVPGVILATINKPKARNSLSIQQHWEADELFRWYDDESSLRVAIITGVGETAFCAGQDLKEQASPAEGKLLRRVGLPPSGFAGLSRRVGKKPVIAAVNGFAVGGGFEICLNCDIVVASPTAEFGLPEALRGLYAGAGGLARLTRNCGLQVASELVLTGRRISATEAKQLNLINRISKSQGSLIDEAIALAQTIDQSSPDSVIVSRAGIREAWETGSVDRAGQLIVERFQARLLSSENRTIGLKAFAQKQKPKWVPSKL